MFSDKQKALDRNIAIVENETIFSDNKEVAEKLNNFFIDAVENLGIKPFEVNKGNAYSDAIDEIDEILNQYELHPSILKIKENITVNEQFKFSDLVEQDMRKQIQQLNLKKLLLRTTFQQKCCREVMILYPITCVQSITIQNIMNPTLPR